MSIDLAAVNQEREQILARIGQLLGRLEVEDPPSISPFLGSGKTVELLAAASEVRGAQEAGEGMEDATQGLLEALEKALAPEEEFDERSTPVVVISLAGLRRLEALLGGLEGK